MIKCDCNISGLAGLPGKDGTDGLPGTPGQSTLLLIMGTKCLNVQI